jgi:hypothetical protein
MSKYAITVNIAKATASKIFNQGLWLYAFKGVIGPTSTKSVVWFKKQAVLGINTISWEVDHSAYISAMSNVAKGTTMASMTPSPMQAGQIANVQADGTISITNSTEPSFAKQYTIYNKSNTPYTCGIANRIAGSLPTDKPAPICAATLNGLGVVSFIPKESIFLTFSDAQHDIGTVLEMSTSPGVVVDLTTQVEPAIVNFDIDNGWVGDANTLPHCTPVTALTSITQVLNSSSQ